MKKLLIIHNGYPLRGDGGDKIRTLNMIHSLKHIGFKVYFVAFYKKDFAWLKSERRKKVNGVNTHFIFTLPDRFGLGRLASLQRSLTIWLFVKIAKIEMVHLETSLSATCVRFLSETIPVIMDFHSDPVPELMMNKASVSCINRAQKDISYALSRSQKLIAVSRNLANNLREYHNYTSTVAILPCSFNQNDFQIDIRDAIELKNKLFLNERIVLCYLGGLHKWQCIEETLDIFIKLKAIEPRYFLCLYTNEDLVDYVEKLKLIGEDCLCKSLSHSEVPLYLSIVDAGFVLRQNSLVNINASPTKIAEYMAVGAMVIATRYSGDAWEMINKCGYGVLLDELDNITNETICLIDDNMKKYLKNKEEASSEIKKCVLMNRLWQVNENKLKELYSEI